MFGFLKDKLKSALKHFTKEVEKETKPEEVQEAEKVQGDEEATPKKISEEKSIDEKNRSEAEKKYMHESKKEVAHKQKEKKEKEDREEKKEEKRKEKEEKENREEKKGENKTEREKPMPSFEPPVVQEQEIKKGFFSKLKEKFVKKEISPIAQVPAPSKEVLSEKHVVETKEIKETIHEKTKRIVEDEEKPREAPHSEKQGFFRKFTEVVTKKTLSEEKFEELFFDLEMVLLENNVAVEVIDLMKQNLKQALVNQRVLRGQISDVVGDSLQKTVDQVFAVPSLDFLSLVHTKKPYVIVFFGVNGSGKTTTIAKIATLLQKHGLHCCIAAGDTFRAAAIQQLEEHANNLGVKLIKHDYGSDPAAVGFDAVKYAQAKHLDCVLIDTAGRLHNKKDLVHEMEKIVRVTKPDLKLFVGESITGNDCVEQAREFHQSIGIDGIILSKADVDDKGGAALSVTYITGKPILFLGTGQRYEDLEVFDKEKVIKQIL